MKYLNLIFYLKNNKDVSESIHKWSLEEIIRMIKKNWPGNNFLSLAPYLKSALQSHRKHHAYYRFSIREKFSRR